MGDSRAAPGSAFGQVDLDLEDEPSTLVRTPVTSEPSFGHIDFDLEEGDDAPPPPSSRVVNTEKNRPTRRAMPAVHDDSTRVLHDDALVAATRPPPPLDEGNTRAWAELDEALFSVGEDDAGAPPPPSSHSRSQASSSGSGSGVAPRDDRVAAMRELYAKGDAAGALALAATLGQSSVPPAGADHRDASVMVEFGEESLDLSDPFGGLIPLDDDLAATPTVAPPAAPPAYAAPQLTLTERHSIPRLLQSMAEISRLKIDHRVGFLLAHVDGMQTLEEILDVCAMPAAEALGLISNLREMGVIEFE